MKTLIAEIEQMPMTFPDWWDGFGAKGINETAANLAKEVLIELSEYADEQTEVNPTCNGTIDISFYGKFRGLVEVGDTSISYYIKYDNKEGGKGQSHKNDDNDTDWLNHLKYCIQKAIKINLTLLHP